MSRAETVLSPRSSLSSSPISSASSIDSPLISDSISDWGEHSRDRSPHSGSASNSASGSESPMTPWNLRPDLGLPTSADRRQDSSEADPNQDDDNQDNNVPPLYLGHTRWKQSQQQGRFASDPLPHTPGQHHRMLSADHADRAGLHRRTRSRTKHTYHTYRNVYYERHLCESTCFHERENLEHGPDRNPSTQPETSSLFSHYASLPHVSSSALLGLHS